jgi:hypothetical protein
MKRHYLYYVDLEFKTAFCSVCGPTDIVVAKSQTGGKSKVFCLNRLQKSKETQKRRISEKRRLQPDWKPRHSLSEIDIETMTATCAVCGRTDIRKRTSNRYTRYNCATKERLYGRKYRRLNYTPRKFSPTAHTLSQIDEEKKTAVCSRCGPVEIYVWQGKTKISRRCSNARTRKGSPAQEIRREFNTNLINRYKIEHGCKRCGYNRNPDRLHLQASIPGLKILKIEKLLTLKRESLLQEFKRVDFLCEICLGLDHAEFEIDGQGREIPLQFSQP